MKAIALLALRAVTVLGAFPLGAWLISLVFGLNNDPNASDDALAVIPFMMIAWACLVAVALIVNRKWLQLKEPAPSWLRWYVRWSVRLALCAGLLVVWD